MRRRSFAQTLAAILLSVYAATPALAAYPERPVRLIVPFAPGGGTDIVGRLVAERLSTALKQPFIVENKPGAGAMLGAELVAKSPADGYTLLMGTSAELTIGPNLSPGSLRYHPVDDFIPVALVGISPNVLLAFPGFAPRNIAELTAYAKAHPQRVSFGSGGAGTGPHLSGELLKHMGGIPMTHVPYRGSGPALADLMSGQTQLMISTMAPALPLIKSQKVRALAVTSDRRSGLLPDVPTVAEQGLPGYHAVTWYAVLAPAATPRDAVERIRQSIEASLKTPEVQERLGKLGIEPPAAASESPALQERIRGELASWAALIKETGIRAE